jgi:hypothetical protein
MHTLILNEAKYPLAFADITYTFVRDLAQARAQFKIKSR